jgi:hypothetical protein
MSDLEQPQNQPEPDPKGSVPLPRDKELEDELQAVKEALDAPKSDRPVAPSDLGSAEEVTLERERGTVRRERVELEGQTKRNGDICFRRSTLVAVLVILALVAVGSLGAIAAGMATGVYPLAASAVLSLSGAGGGSVFAWNVYVKATTPSKPQPEPVGEGP